MTQEALKLALEALEMYGNRHRATYLLDGAWDEEITLGGKAITAIKEALAQTQEPVATVESVATVVSESGNQEVTMSWWHEPALPVGTKLYTAPPQRTWVGLTDEEIKPCWYEACQTDLELTSQLVVYFAKAIEAKLKEKNT